MPAGRASRPSPGSPPIHLRARSARLRRGGSTQSRHKRAGPGAPITKTIDWPSRLHARPEGSTGYVVTARGAVVGVPASFTSVSRTVQCSGCSNGRNTPIEPHAKYASRRPSAENVGRQIESRRGRSRDRTRLSCFHRDRIQAGDNAVRKARVPARDDVAAVGRPGDLRAKAALPLDHTHWKFTELRIRTAERRCQVNARRVADFTKEGNAPAVR